MARPLPLRNTKKRPVDAEDFIRKVQIALATKDEFVLEIYKSLYPKYSGYMKESLKKAGLHSLFNGKDKTLVEDT